MEWPVNLSSGASCSVRANWYTFCIERKEIQQLCWKYWAPAPKKKLSHTGFVHPWLNVSDSICKVTRKTVYKMNFRLRISNDASSLRDKFLLEAAVHRTLEHTGPCNTGILLQSTLAWMNWNVNVIGFKSSPLWFVELPPFSTGLPEELVAPQLVRKFPTFYRTQGSITVSTTARHLSLPCAISIQSMTSQFQYYPPNYVWIYQVVSFPSVLPTKIPWGPLISLTRATLPAHLISLISTHE